MNVFRSILFLTSVFLLSYGWGSGRELSAIIGASIYLVALSSNLISVVELSRKYTREENSDSIEGKHSRFSFSRILEGLILVVGLITTGSDNKLFSTPGMIIWLGSIIIYLVSGTIVSRITKLPLKMGYGGWFISHYKKRK